MLSWAIGEFTANIHLKSKIPQTYQPTCGKVLCRSPVSGTLEEDRPNINASSVKRAHSNVLPIFPLAQTIPAPPAQQQLIIEPEAPDPKTNWMCRHSQAAVC